MYRSVFGAMPMTAWERIVLPLSCVVLLASCSRSRGSFAGPVAPEQTQTSVSSANDAGGSSADLLRAGFESQADRACPPVYVSDGLTCMTPPPQGTWFAVSASNASYVNDPTQCHSGNWCGAITLPPAKSQLNTMWDWTRTLPTQFYVQGWWKFPKDWQWNTTDIDHKAIIFETNTPSNARMYLNFRAESSQSAQICVTTNAYIISHNSFVCANRGKKDAVVRADDVWHSVQAYVNEAGNQVRVWLDGTLVIQTAELGFGDGAPYKEIKFGAYMGGAAAAKKGGPRTFYIDDLCISSAPCQAVSEPAEAARRGETSRAVQTGSN